MKVTATKGRIIVIGLAIFGVCSSCIGAILLVFFQDIVRFFMEHELVLKEGYEFYDIWKDIPIPAHQKIYIFNITNPDDFVKKGSKPVLKEVGPYVYRGRWYKDELSWDDEDGTVTYRDFKDYEFAPEFSVGTQDEMIYTLNAPLLAVINYVEDYSPSLFRSFVVEMMNGIFESYNETLLVHRTVRELIYEGYHEPMVADLTKLIESFVTLPLKLVNDTFGILHERKHVGDGVFTIRSGVKGLHDYSNIQQWNNQSVVDWWDGETCNEIRGTDGIQYPPFVNRTQILTMFNPNLCRTLPLVYEKDVTVHGIKAFRFGMPSDTLANSQQNPDNECYCHGSNCISGILPMNCKKGAPFVLSFPHFLEADNDLQTALEGVDPQPEKHKTFVDVEPTTGLVLNGAFRMQLNGVTRRLPSYKALQNSTAHIIPVIWMSEEAQLDMYFANYFKSRVQTPLIVFKVLSLTAVAMGVFWTISSIIFLLCIQAKVKPEDLKNSLVLKTLNTVYTSVSLWPPAENEGKEPHETEKTLL